MPSTAIRRLEFDSTLFGRAIGSLQFESGDDRDVAAALESARRDGYQYLVCRPRLEDTALICELGRAGFYLSDQGVTWAIETAAFREQAASPDAVDDLGGLAAPSISDIPELQRMGLSMFLDSRFYNDPFFSFADAERLHQEWVKNSVTGAAADSVLWLPQGGFITMKQRQDTGEVVLVGIVEGRRRRGLGRTLLSAAMAWFRERGVARVTVRTQLRNLRASNFYRAHGFVLAGADVTFSRIL